MNAGSFHLIDGHFSAATAGLKVTFTAYAGTDFHVIGSQTMTLGETDTLVKFSRIFKDVTGISIGLDEHTTQASFAMDDLRVKLLGAAAAGGGADADSLPGAHGEPVASHPAASAPYPVAAASPEPAAHDHAAHAPYAFEGGGSHDGYFLA